MKSVLLQIQEAVKNARKNKQIGLHYVCASYVDTSAVVILLLVFMQENIMKIQDTL